MTPLPMVVLPGMLCSPRLFGGSDRCPGDRRVVHLPLDGASVDACVDAVLAVAPRRFALLGHSLGGVVAMALARRAPQRVLGLALLATSALPPTDAQHGAWAATRADLAGGVRAREVQRALLPVLLRAGGDPAGRVALVALGMADDVGEAALDAQLAAQATRVDERPALARVAVPTLVLVGAQDVLTPPERAREIAALVPGAHLEVVGGAGHLAPLDAPGAVASAVRGWLLRTGSAAGDGPGRGTAPSAPG